MRPISKDKVAGFHAFLVRKEAIREEMVKHSAMIQSIDLGYEDGDRAHHEQALEAAIERMNLLAIEVHISYTMLVQMSIFSHDVQRYYFVLSQERDRKTTMPYEVSVDEREIKWLIYDTDEVAS